MAQGSLPRDDVCAKLYTIESQMERALSRGNSMCSDRKVMCGTFKELWLGGMTEIVKWRDREGFWKQRALADIEVGEIEGLNGVVGT